LAINKNAFIRYQTLDKCFKNIGRNYYIDDLLSVCNEALYELNPNAVGIKKRQLFDDIKFMESSQGWSIPLVRHKDGKKVFYRYEDANFSINQQPINDLEAEQLKSALLVLARFKGLPQFEWIQELILKLEQQFQLQNTTRELISFDANEYLKGIEYLGTLFNAILYKRVLQICYKSFSSDAVTTVEIHPQYLKQYNNRWFLLGQNPEYKTLTNFALDRIVTIAEVNTEFKEVVIDFDAYFEDIVGVTKPVDEQPVLITLQATKSLAPYIITKPLHGSQKHIKNDDDGLLFSIEVIPNYELEKQLLAFGEGLVVCSPDSFKSKLKERIQKLHELYN
jgi:predicted DNA-binding transcriptional regulator YafY